MLSIHARFFSLVLFSLVFIRLTGLACSNNVESCIMLKGNFTLLSSASESFSHVVQISVSKSVF